MKKFLAILLASASMMAVCAFTACGDKDDDASDQVTQAEWTSAFMSSKFLNVTVGVKYSDSYTFADGTSDTSSGSGTLKTAFTLDSSTGYITGNGYTYSTYSDSDGESEEFTYYESFSSGSHNYVEKNTLTNGNEVWYGDKYFSSGTLSDSECYIYGEITKFVSEYSSFEYVDGAYKYVETYELNGSNYYESLNYTYYIKIKEGYLTSIILEEDDYDYTDSYSTNSKSREEYTFSNYGSTSVTIPTEYTYNYYVQYNS